MGKVLKKGQALIAHLFMLNVEAQKEQEQTDKAIQEVLNQYVDVFVEPKSLPHIRALGHAIPLKPGSLPVSLRPYRYNYHQKDELEK